MAILLGFWLGGAGAVELQTGILLSRGQIEVDNKFGASPPRDSGSGRGYRVRGIWPVLNRLDLGLGWEDAGHLDRPGSFLGVQGLAASVGSHLNWGERSRLTGRAGVYGWETEFGRTNEGNGVHPFLELGLDYSLGETTGVSLNWARYWINAGNDDPSSPQTVDLRLDCLALTFNLRSVAKSDAWRPKGPRRRPGGNNPAKKPDEGESSRESGTEQGGS